jgi:hypothetical protein
MYATGSNDRASDGTRENGAFTKILLDHMDNDESIENVAIAIRTKLLNDTRLQGVQVGNGYQFNPISSYLQRLDPLRL